MTRSVGLNGIAFVGGGSGGHVFPGIALAERACERFPDCRSTFFSTPRRVEDHVFAGSVFERRALPLSAPGRRAADWLRYSFAVARSTRTMRHVLRDGFDVVFGLGGYASVPGVLAARMEGLPVILLEQNRVAGRVNRMLAPLASAVSCSFGESSCRGARWKVTGNPIRRAVLDALRAGATEGERVGGSQRRRTVLVVGGSQGSHGINRRLLSALEGLSTWRERIHWIHVTGETDRDLVETTYQDLGWSAEVCAFSSDLPQLMRKADLVISRSGGTTLSELAVLGVPAVLVPYPYHRDQHQLLNARAYADAGAAVVVDEKDLDAVHLGSLFEEIFLSPGRLRKMAESARGRGRPDAADLVLDLAVELNETCRTASVSFS